MEAVQEVTPRCSTCGTTLNVQLSIEDSMVGHICRRCQMLKDNKQKPTYKELVEMLMDMVGQFGYYTKGEDGEQVLMDGGLSSLEWSFDMLLTLGVLKKVSKKYEHYRLDHKAFEEMKI